MKVVSWNIAGRSAPWELVVEMLEAREVDVALLQEARSPRKSIADLIEVDPGPWNTAGVGVRRDWKAAVVVSRDRTDTSVHWVEARSIPEAGYHDLAVSRPGTLAAAVVTPADGLPVTVVSMYAAAEGWTGESGRPSHNAWVGSAHRLISDLSRLVGKRTRLIAAGDLNAWRSRESIFTRMDSLDLPCVGPHAPGGGRQAPEPRHAEDVVTFYLPAEREPANATQQLDYVFATRNIAERVEVRALNDASPEVWGPSDHCRILIEVP
ncbi:MAG: endonuclease/exonuclease/phosphatase family protein [Chloroflexi bacterium]|nr:endonuclease/exonuclease/phosphatase family protein [Chloroflexota bacterium]